MPIDNELKASISIDVIDKYLEACSYTDDTAPIVPHTSGVVRERYNPQFLNKIGGEFSVTYGDAQADNTSVHGIVAGSMPYYDAPTAGLVLGTGAESFQFLYIKHTGFEYSSATALGDATTVSVMLRKQTSTSGGGTYANICTIRPGQFAFFPTTDTLPSGCTWNAKADHAGSRNIAIQYAMLRPDL